MYIVSAKRQKKKALPVKDRRAFSTPKNLNTPVYWSIEIENYDLNQYLNHDLYIFRCIKTLAVCHICYMPRINSQVTSTTSLQTQVCKDVVS